MVTITSLKTVFPAAAEADLDAFVHELAACSPACGVGTPLRLAHFLAQVRQETGPALDGLSENLNYSPAALSKFSYYKARPQEAVADGYLKENGRIVRRANPEAIANKAYADRMGNGNVASGDGWRFRGRGCIQVTGRETYAQVTHQCQQLFTGQDVDYVAHPERMAELPGALRSALGYWVMHGLHLLADRGSSGSDVDRITAVVNRYTDSYDDRRANFELAWRALG